MAKPKRQKGNRNNRIALIKIAAKNQGLVDDDGNEAKGKLSSYREMLKYATGKTSLADMSDDEHFLVIEYLEKAGALHNPRRRTTYPGRPSNMDNKPRLEKIEAQLTELSLPWSYADAIAKRMYKVDKVEWLNESGQLDGIIAALHTEQKKRRTLAAIEDRLTMLEMTPADADQLAADMVQKLRIKRPKDWTRNEALLLAVADHLAEELLRRNVEGINQ